jgi:hypothetical protein
MSIPEILKICVVIYFVAILIDLFRLRRFSRFLFQLMPLVGLLVIDIVMAGAKAGYVTFGGGTSPTLVDSRKVTITSCYASKLSFPPYAFNPWEARIMPNVPCRSWLYPFVAWASSALNFS